MVGANVINLLGFLSADDECFVLWGNSGEYFNSGGEVRPRIEGQE